MAKVRGSDRPGHDLEHALHGLRPRRRRSSASPSRSTGRSTPSPGGSSTTPTEIWATAQEVVAGRDDAAGAGDGDIAASGITNQRETTVVWDRAHRASRSTTPSSGRTRAPTSSCDELSRDGGQDRFREQTGLPLATYFSGPKIRWLLDNVAGARATRAEAGELLFGTIDTWLIWNLTGGTDGGLHVTDVTNASRTMLMNLDDARLGRRDPGRAWASRGRCCPQIKPSSEVYGDVRAGRAGGRAAGRRPRRPAGGDSSARRASRAGEAKNTYGTGCFLLLNTGTEPVASQDRAADHGRLQDRRPGRRSTAWRARSRSPARSCSGCATTWSMIKAAPEIEDAGASRRGQRRLLHRAGLLRSVRAVLEVRRPRRDRRASRATSPRATSRARRWRRPRYQTPRGGGGDERRLRRAS